METVQRDLNNQMILIIKSAIYEGMYSKMHELAISAKNNQENENQHQKVALGKFQQTSKNDDFSGSSFGGASHGWSPQVD